jgi:hypothetical protein
MKIPKLTSDELKIVRSSLRAARPAQKVYDHAFYGKHIRFGYYSDPHVGEKHFHQDLWLAMIKKFKAEGIKNVYCPGDKQICHLISLFAGNPLEN